MKEFNINYIIYFNKCIITLIHLITTFNNYNFKPKYMLYYIYSIYTVVARIIGTLGKYDQRRIWK